MSLGYGFHISLSEAIPNTLREGMVRTTGAMVSRVVSRLGYDAAESDADPRGIAGWLWRMGGKKVSTTPRTPRPSSKRGCSMGAMHARLASRVVSRWSVRPSPCCTPRMASSRQGPSQVTRPMTGRRWETRTQSSPNCTGPASGGAPTTARLTAAKAYIQAAHDGKTPAEGTIAARNAVVDELHNEPGEVLANYARSYGKRSQSPDGWDNLTDWADSIVSRMKGLVHGRPTDVDNKVAGPINMDLLRSMGNGHTPPLETFERLNAAERPLHVEGQVIVPSGHNLVGKIANAGFRKILDPMVNAISRNQEFAVEYLKQYHDLTRAVEKGTISEDERAVMANYRAVAHGARSFTT